MIIIWTREKKCDKISIINPILNEKKKQLHPIQSALTLFVWMFTPLERNKWLKIKDDKNQRSYSLSANCSHIILNRGTTNNPFNKTQFSLEIRWLDKTVRALSTKRREYHRIEQIDAYGVVASWSMGPIISR